MKRPLRLLAFSKLLLAGALIAIFPSESIAESPQETQAQDAPVVRPWALVVLPREESTLEKDGWLGKLEQYPDLRLTVAFSSQDSRWLAGVRSQIVQLKNQSKLELALRLNGDPPLPLIYDLDLAKIHLGLNAQLPSVKIAWPEDVMGQIIREKMDFKEFWNDWPKGFVPGGGSLNLPIAEFLKKQKFYWVLAGFPESEWQKGAILTLQEGKEVPLLVLNADPLANLFYPE